jgi:hypothetical protein
VFFPCLSCNVYIRDSPDSSSCKQVQPAISSVVALVLKPGWDLEEDKEDWLELRHTLQQCKHLCNSEMLEKLPSQMEHLDNDQTNDFILLIVFSMCFRTFQVARPS